MAYPAPPPEPALPSRANNVHSISQRQLDMTDLLLKFLPVDFITDVSKNYIINLV